MFADELLKYKVEMTKELKNTNSRGQIKPWCHKFMQSAINVNPGTVAANSTAFNKLFSLPCKQATLHLFTSRTTPHKQKYTNSIIIFEKLQDLKM